MFIQKFTSGCPTVNGKYSLFAIGYRGVLTVEITENEVSITSFGVSLWKLVRSDISIVKIKPEVLGATVNISSHDGKGFMFIVDNVGLLVENLKKFNYPAQCDESALKSEAKRYKFATNPIVLAVFCVPLILIIFVFLWLPVN